MPELKTPQGIIEAFAEEHGLQYEDVEALCLIYLASAQHEQDLKDGL